MNFILAESKQKKVIYLLGLLLSFFLFFLSLELIKYFFSGAEIDFLRLLDENVSEVNAFGIGWLLTLILQSSGATTSALAAINSAGIIEQTLLVFMVIGTRIGTTITFFLVALFISAKERDFRHGFEIGLANIVYALPIAVLMFFMEYLFSFFSNIGNYFISIQIPFEFISIDSITLPLIKLLDIIVPPYLFPFLGIVFLIFSLKKMPYFIVKFCGETYLRKSINKYMGDNYFSFLTGLIIALILTSTSVTLALLIPLIVVRLINLKKAIPYLIGTNLGGVMDAVIGGLVIGKTAIPAVFTYVSFSIIGLFWFFNTDLLFSATKFLSKKILYISKKRAILFVLLFSLVAFILSLI